MARSQSLRALVGATDGRAALSALATSLPEEVVGWLGQLALLEGVPFACLVPDARMLPAESIRFFYLDDNWWTAARDGALSVVDLSQQDEAMIGVHHDRIDEAMAAGAARLRARRRARARRRRGDPAPVDPPVVLLEPPPRPWTGLLLRSAVVSDWPGVEVKGYADEAGADQLQLLRLERLAPTVLLAIFGGIVQRVTVAKPAQGLHFGVVADDEAPVDATRAYEVYLRGLGGKFPTGEQLPGGRRVEVPLRPDPAGRKVVDVTALQGRLTAALLDAYQPEVPPQDPPVGPGAFGLELVAGAELQAFVPHPLATAPPVADEAAAAPAPRPVRADAVTIDDLRAALNRGR